MLSLARQLALRREIEEELAELAGEARAADWGECVSVGLVVTAPLLPPVRCCVVCSTALPGRGKRTYCEAHRPQHWTGKDRHSPRSIARTQARKRQARRDARAGRTCCDCAAPLPDEANANTRRCAACARAAAAENSRRQVERRTEQRRARREAEQQRRAA